MLYITVSYVQKFNTKTEVTVSYIIIKIFVTVLPKCNNYVKKNLFIIKISIMYIGVKILNIFFNYTLQLKITVIIILDFLIFILFV